MYILMIKSRHLLKKLCTVNHEKRIENLMIKDVFCFLFFFFES